jgi:ketosteroid isomerase-like protein
MDTNDRDVSQQIIALERQALARWSNGDPLGCLELSAPDVVYFDPFLDHRIDGREDLATYYAALRGKIFAKHFELIDPVVQLCDSVAILTFNFVCQLSSGTEQRWNCTEVYRRDDVGWRIIQTHWSFTNPARNAAASEA